MFIIIIVTFHLPLHHKLQGAFTVLVPSWHWGELTKTSTKLFGLWQQCSGTILLYSFFSVYFQTQEFWCLKMTQILLYEYRINQERSKKKWESNETGGERWERELEPSHRGGASLLLYKQVLMLMLMLMRTLCSGKKLGILKNSPQICSPPSD